MNRRRHNFARRAGFTLIEVLAALVLIGVVLPVAMRGVSVSLAAAAKARHTGEATELARNKLAELAMGTDTAAYTGTGDFGTDWPDYRWESRTAARDYGVNELSVEVFWKARGQEQSLVLTTLTYPNGYLVGTAATDTTAATGGTTP